MPERSFEARLERLFSEAPAFADAEYFTARLDERLTRDFGLRRLLIGGLGVAGGLVVVWQVAASALGGRLAQMRPLIAGLGPGGGLEAHFSAIAQARFLPAGFPLNGEMFWMSTAAAVVAIGFAISRVVREF
ncbi:MAG: hypothetical protein ACRED9_04075 [Caulobacteraceae bacterium]